MLTLTDLDCPVTMIYNNVYTYRQVNAGGYFYQWHYCSYSK